MRPIAAVSRLHLVVSFSELLAAGGCERVKARLAVVGGGSPLRADPAAVLQPLERRIKRAVFYQQFLVGRLLDGARDALAVLRPEKERAQNEQVERALEEFEAVFGSLWRFLGRHLT